MPDFYRIPSVKTLMRWIPVVFIAIIILSAITWNELNKTGWSLQNVYFWGKVNKDSSNKLDNLQDFWLPSNKDSSNKLDNLQDFRLPRNKDSSNKLEDFRLPSNKDSSNKLNNLQVFQLPSNKDSSNKLEDFRLPSNKDSSNKLDNLQVFRLPGNKDSRIKLDNLQDFRLPSNKDSINKLDNLQDFRLPSNKDSSNKLDNLQDVRLPRMIYPQPDTLMQTRRDVLTLSPWLAPIVWAGTYNRDILNEQFKLRNVTVGIALFAIKKYVVFLQLILDTAEKFFMVGHNVNYYVFTDHPEKVPNITLAPGRQIITLLSPAYKRWQDVVLRRMEMLRNASRDTFIHQVDYIVSLDVDMKFSDVVGVEILGDLFGTIHPGFYNAFRQQFTYERRPASQAYIPEDEGDFYYTGALFGGTVSEFYKLTEYCYKGIMMDKENAIEAVWQEESHMNKYFVGKKPTKILSPEYVYASYMGSPAILRTKRFVAVPKNYSEIRYN